MLKNTVRCEFTETNTFSTGDLIIDGFESRDVALYEKSYVILQIRRTVFGLK
jgi:hypothetical protein